MDATVEAVAEAAALHAQHAETQGEMAASAIKERLRQRFVAYLDGLDEQELEAVAETAKAPNEASDLASVFVELAALRIEVRTQSRLLKEALDQFRSVFDTLQISHAAMEVELKRARAETEEKQREVMKPLLLEIIDIRDRLHTAVKPSGAGPRWYERLYPKVLQDTRASEREGIGMIVRRLERMLAERRVVPTEVLGRPFNPRIATAVATVERPGVADGQVVEELRPGFLWNDDLLRPAEVIVAKRGGKEDVI
jgi:molecular chaperone GrpE